MKSAPRILNFATAIFVLFSFSTCSLAQIKTQTGEPWTYSTPEQQGFDSEVFVELLDRIEKENLDIHSIILMRKNQIFFEFYNYPYTDSTSQHAMSVGKSVTSALVGICLDEGLIKDLDTPILDFFPEYKDSINNPEKFKITLRHALNMTTGLALADNNFENLAKVTANENWVLNTLKSEMDAKPGEKFTYASFVSHLIAQSVTKASKEDDLMNFAKAKLFDPIGMGKINEVMIERTPAGNWFGAGGLWLTSKDLPRFGKLFLDEGKWNGKQIISKEWVKTSTTNQIGDMQASISGKKLDKYGYQWWVFGDSYAAIGVGGQQIFIIPELDFVAVITRADPDIKTDVMNQYVLKALKSPYFAASKNPDAVKKMNALIDRLGKPKQESIFLSENAHEISGKTFVAEDSTFYKSFSFNFDKEKSEYSFNIETKNETLSYKLGSPRNPYLNIIESNANRPKGISYNSAYIEQSDNETLSVDLNEVGYPVKIRWEIKFSGNKADIKVSGRGASQSSYSFTAIIK